MCFRERFAIGSTIGNTIGNAIGNTNIIYIYIYIHIYTHVYIWPRAAFIVTLKFGLGGGLAGHPEPLSDIPSRQAFRQTLPTYVSDIPLNHRSDIPSDIPFRRTLDNPDDVEIAPGGGMTCIMRCGGLQLGLWLKARFAQRPH